MRNLVRTSMVVAVVLSLGTVAYAVAETGHRPDVTQIPVVVTGHPADLASVRLSTGPVVQPSTTPTPLAAGPAKTQGVRSSGSAKSSGSTKRTRSVTRASPGTSSQSQPTAEKAEDTEHREVVTPVVRDESDDSGHESVVPKPEGERPHDTEPPKTMTD